MGAIAESYPAQGQAARIVVGDQAVPAGSPTGGLPDREPDIAAEITRIDQSGMLVEENPGAAIGNKIVFHTTTTQRVRRVNGELVPMQNNAPVLGERVAVWASGAIAESFPAQGNAAVILVDDALPAAPTTSHALPTRPAENHGRNHKD